MNKHYLKFNNQQEAKEFYKDLNIWNDEFQVPLTASHRHSLDIIGQIIRDGEWDEEGNELSSPQILDGYHVNFIGELPEKWNNYEVFPTTPHRVWF